MSLKAKETKAKGQNAAKPEETVKKEPKRLKDKERIKAAKAKKKALKKQKQIAKKTDSKGQPKALDYLEAWANDRDNWKFEKCRQIWLLQNAFDVDRVPDDKFPDLLNYIDSIKGGMRKIVEGEIRPKI